MSTENLNDSAMLQNVKKMILVIEDNELNREILTEILSSEYEVLTAENGEVGLELLKKYREKLSLVLLDVYMPVCNGFEFLEKIHSDSYLSSVPIIVATGSNKHEDEERCVKLGATDFITKPYQPESLLTRIHNIIRYKENLSTLAVVEYDEITQLYTMSAFYHHTEQLLADSDEEYDLLLWEIRDYAALTNVLGRKRAYEIIKYIAFDLKNKYPNAIIARRSGRFYLLDVHSSHFDSNIITEQNRILSASAPVANIRILTGIYKNIDKKQPMTILCNRVQLGLKYNTGDKSHVVYYDDELENRYIQEQNILLNFEDALENEEFVLRFQPKIQVSTGKVVGAESLVRWIDSTGQMLSPGIFIPLLENEDIIHILDEYVFRKVCETQKKHRELTGICMPISINISRNSLYRDDVIERYTAIANEYLIDLSLIPIEVTESAVVADNKILKTCKDFVEAGFALHMDDFGSGLSSLSSLIKLPFSVIKIDKSMTDQLGNTKGAIIIKSIIDMARSLGMSVVAEGVEEEQQVLSLKKMKCDEIQGFYFSVPLSADDFIEFVENKNGDNK